ncbi:TPA: hypothetical protein EYH33_07540 [Candidatus Bipolaricaulota bacterium]|nr:hypothetical protein [Candidatus Bipolaricaulota bacterium]
MRKSVLLLVMLLGGVVVFPLVAAAQEAPRDPLVHGLASFLIPGLGQYLNGEPDKALVHFLVAVAIPTVGYYVGAITINPFLFYITPLAQLGWSLYSAMDAYNVAQAYNEAHGFSLLEFDLALGG